MKVLKRWLISGLLALVVVASFGPGTVSAAPKAPKHFADQPSDAMFLEREDADRLLTVKTDSRRGSNYEVVRLDARRSDRDINEYRVVGTWNSSRMDGNDGDLRVTDVGALELWMRMEGKDEDPLTDSDNLKAQVLVEVLKNGLPATSAESGCVTLYPKSVTPAPVIFNVPAPSPAMELTIGDQLSVRVSARHGSAIAIDCGGAMNGKARIEYGSAERPSKINFTFTVKPPEVVYLERVDENRVLTLATEGHKGSKHDEVRLDPRRNDPDINEYRVLGTWNTRPVIGVVRVIDVGALEFWMRTEGRDEDPLTDSDFLKAQVRVEVLKNGVPATSAESGCVTLYPKSVAPDPVIFNVPAPYPAITLNPSNGLVPSDQLSVRVSARHGSAIGCGGATNGKARLEYGSAERPSKINFTFGGATSIGSTFTFSGPAVKKAGVWWITPLTIIRSTIYSSVICEATLTFPAATNPPASAIVGPCPGTILGSEFTGVPAMPPAWGTFKLTLVASLSSTDPSLTASDLLEVYSVDALPAP